MKLDGYIRVSRVNGREGDSFISPDVQRDKIAAFAKVMDATVVKWHTDLDQSGGKLNRPGLNAALERIEAGKTGGLIVAKIDRFARAAEAGAVVKTIIENGGIFASADDRLDPTTYMGKAMLGIILVFAEMELDRTRESWRDSRRRAVERGIHVASKAPTGYVRDADGRLEPDPASAPHIAEVYRQKAAGASWRDLALYLREHEVESPYGNLEWQPRALSHIIPNRVYLGEARSGEFTNPEAHEPLVDEATWLAAQPNAKGVRSSQPGGSSLLSGLMRCDGCGYVMKPDTITDRDGGKVRMYRCRTERATGRCPKPASVLERVVAPLVVDAFMDGLRGMRAEGTPLTNDLAAVETGVVDAERELAAYVEAVSAEDVGVEVFKAGAQKRKQAVETAQASLDQARERAGLADLPVAADLEADWPDLTTQERNQLLRAGIDRVVLTKGRVPIEQRARIVWKGESDV